MSNVLTPGYTKGDSSNLPECGALMVVNFFTNDERFISVETRGSKFTKSTREDYSNNAVGFVQVKRVGRKCYVLARVTPEHRNKNAGYRVEVHINETNSAKKITKAQCLDCAASLGGCKHIVSLVMWLHRKSEEPAPTEKVCYWKKSLLADVGSRYKYVLAENFNCDIRTLLLEQTASTQNPKDNETNNNNDTTETESDGSTTDSDSDKSSTSTSDSEDEVNFLQDIVASSKELRCSGQLFAHFHTASPSVRQIEMYTILGDYQGDLNDIDSFLSFCSMRITQELCDNVATATTEQSNISTWHKVRVGRITASNFYQAAHCKTDGSLVQIILGSVAPFDSNAMKRGRRLEPLVLAALERKLGKKLKTTGIIFNGKYPVFGASPDGICDEFTVEIKCPMSENSKKNYVLPRKGAAPKVYAQMQLQMFLTGKSRGLLCVASPSFETTGEFEITYVDFDRTYVIQNMRAALNFWKSFVYPKLILPFLPDEEDNEEVE